jgi:hypothetical protein
MSSPASALLGFASSPAPKAAPTRRSCLRFDRVESFIAHLAEIVLQWEAECEPLRQIVPADAELGYGGTQPQPLNESL